MGIRKEQFLNGEIYHVISRGIDDNLIFKNEDDYYRGIFSIYEFNNSKTITIRERRKIRARIKKLQKRADRNPVPVSSVKIPVKDLRDKLVEVLAFCLMPNHIHLLLKQLKEEGISKYMMKVSGGYGRYFNRKYSRKGHIFQDRFLAVHIEDDEQLKTVFVYIHTNPISIVEPKWKEKGIRDSKKVTEFLENYKWSSYQDYIGRKNFPSVTEREFILKLMGGEKSCREFVEYWVKYKNKEEKPHLSLEQN